MEVTESHWYTPKGHLLSLRINLLLLLILFLPTGTAAQEVSGRVYGKSHSPLESVNVLCLNAKGKILSYSVTDSLGQFNIELKDSADNIKVSALGYATRVIPVGEMHGGMKIILKEDVYTLKEVKVTSNRIQSSGDTLTYSVSGFKQRQDRSIADVIAKMPGLEVGNDGSVKFQGKAISKFYVEGLDLLGSQYGMGNKNISADKIASVQVLQNHQPVKSLKGVQFSDQAALNLVLRDDVNDMWSSTVDAGLGYGDGLLYDNRIMALRFRKNFQTLLLYKNNNTGKDISSEIRDLVSQENESGKPSSLLRMASQSIPNIDRERYTLNDSHMAAGNLLFKLGTDSELRIQGSAFVDKTHSESNTHTTYLTQAGMPVLIENEDLDNKRSEWKGEINYQYNGNKMFISNNLRGYMDFNKGEGSSTLDGVQTARLVQPRSRSLSDRMKMSYVTKRHDVYQLDAGIDYYYMPGKLLTLSDGIEQVFMHYLNANASFNYSLSLGRFRIDNKVSVAYLNEDVNGRTDSSALGKGSYYRQSAGWSPSVSVQWGDHRLSAFVDVKYVNQKYGGNRLGRLWADPRLSYRWTMNGYSTLSLAASLGHTPLGLYDVCDVPLFSDYRTRIINRGTPKYTSSQVVSVSYRFSDPLSGLFFIVQPSYRHVTNNTLYTYSLNGSLYTMTATDSTAATGTGALYARLSKTFAWAKTFVALGAHLQASSYKLLVANEMDDASMARNTFFLDYSLRPVSWMALEGRSEVMTSKLKNDTRPELSSVTAVDWSHTLKTYFFPTDRLTFQLNNSITHTNDKDFGTNYFLDILASYRFKHMEWSVSCNNIIGKDHIERINVSETLSAMTTYRLRPREIIVKCTFDIN